MVDENVDLRDCRSQHVCPRFGRRIGEIQVFTRVVEADSFSKAACLPQMTPSTVSKLLNRIEQRLGVRLLERSTRRLSLTDEGLIYHEWSLALLARWTPSGASRPGLSRFHCTAPSRFPATAIVFCCGRYEHTVCNATISRTMVAVRSKRRCLWRSHWLSMP
ncbi:LysR family transcriptional regulator [Agrobacterium vitis]|nr:LysR family transcriptional regulator [Agrobacterium vitis]